HRPFGHVAVSPRLRLHYADDLACFAMVQQQHAFGLHSIDFLHPPGPMPDVVAGQQVSSLCAELFGCFSQVHSHSLPYRCTGPSPSPRLMCASRTPASNGASSSLNDFDAEKMKFDGPLI